MKLKACEIEKAKATFQLLSIHDKTDRENDAFAKFTPGLSEIPTAEPVEKEAKVVFVDFNTPGNNCELPLFLAKG